MFITEYAFLYQDFLATGMSVRGDEVCGAHFANALPISSNSCSGMTDRPGTSPCR
jgi:hypothetical protein